MPIQSSPIKATRRERRVLITILILDLLVVGGLLFYVLHPQRTPLTTALLPTPAQKPQAEPMPAPNTTYTSSTAPTVNRTVEAGEEDRVRNVLSSYFDALNQHAIERAVALFTDNVEIVIKYGEGYTYQGPKEGLKRYLTTAFSLAPDAVVENVSFTDLSIIGDRATAQSTYVLHSRSYDLLQNVTEYFELVKQDNVWKISKTEIEISQ